MRRPDESERLIPLMLTLCHILISPPLRCSSGFDRHRQDWVDNSCPDEVQSPRTREKNRWRRCLASCNTSSCFSPRQRTSCATSPTPHTATPPSPPRWSPKPQPGAERPRLTGTRPPPPRRPPASPLKVTRFITVGEGCVQKRRVTQARRNPSQMASSSSSSCCHCTFKQGGSRSVVLKIVADVQAGK